MNWHSVVDLVSMSGHTIRECGAVLSEVIGHVSVCSAHPVLRVAPSSLVPLGRHYEVRQYHTAS